MESLETLRTFFGWTVIVHAAVMLFAYGLIMLAGDFARSVHAKAFGLSDHELQRAYFQFFAWYKLGIWLFAIGPWVALHLMT